MASNKGPKKIPFKFSDEEHLFLSNVFSHGKRFEMRHVTSCTRENRQKSEKRFVPKLEQLRAFDIAVIENEVFWSTAVKNRSSQIDSLGLSEVAYGCENESSAVEAKSSLTVSCLQGDVSVSPDQHSDEAYLDALYSDGGDVACCEEECEEADEVPDELSDFDVPDARTNAKFMTVLRSWASMRCIRGDHISALQKMLHDNKCVIQREDYLQRGTKRPVIPKTSKGSFGHPKVRFWVRRCPILRITLDSKKRGKVVGFYVHLGLRNGALGRGPGTFWFIIL
jgi:hypothetical protein